MDGRGGEKTMERIGEDQELGGIPILKRDEERRRKGSTSIGGPVCVIVVGMAGSGKTTLMHQLQLCLEDPFPAASETEVNDEEYEKKGELTDIAASEAVEVEVVRSEHLADSEGDKGECSPTRAHVVGGGKKGNESKVETDRLPEDAQRVPLRPAVEEGTPSDRSRKVGYFLNLDPATKLVPFGASIDIRDTVDYKEVMRQHNYGPNGAIMTSLNLFATKFDQVLAILERRAFGDSAARSATEEERGATEMPQRMDYILVDTPGQIEAFTWSASGSIIGEGLASAFPTVLAFVVDTPRCASSPHTFMSNMLYACSMLYRTKLPLVLVFNKIDVVPHDFALQWMDSHDSFQDALDAVSSESGYYGSLTRSLGLVLDEFYATLRRCGVSAATGDGLHEFWAAVTLAAQDFQSDYLVDLRNRVAENRARTRAAARDSVRRLARDVAKDNASD